MPSQPARDPHQEASLDQPTAAGVGVPIRADDHLAMLRAAWREGVASGDYEPLDATLDALAARFADPRNAEL
ncbi:hypothetical protein MKL09_20605 [Methylobacterium sp. J-048]|uniref:hypothetical protein n=1 Tax=Methylobacterium sp. J-048 TaxID=2836635 RepID=UPI001FB86307|nr:hypothetical protein [Methylobacterium sp. J-048]MCJ2058936.1 hypothetical protein [Methylobacterium sp. J-048]